MAFVAHNEYFTPQVMQLLKDAGIDYYTRWDHAQGKGHGTDPHLGMGSYASMNARSSPVTRTPLENLGTPPYRVAMSAAWKAE